MDAKELHEVFERVAGKVPELRTPMKYDLPGGRKLEKRLHHSTAKGLGWSLRTVDDDLWVAPIHDKHAESLIIAACARLLPGHFWEPCGDGFVVLDVNRPEGMGGVTGKSLAIALLLAVEAKNGGKHET